MSYLYSSNRDPQDQFTQLEIQLDSGASAIVKMFSYYDLSATEVARADPYIILVQSAAPADSTPIGITRLPVEGTLAEGDVPVWSEDNASFVPGQAGGGGGSDASTSVKGISKLSVAPTSASNPIAVGTNDARVTGDQGAGTASIRTLGSGSTQAAAGDLVATLASTQTIAAAATGVAATDTAEINSKLATGLDVEVPAGNYLVNAKLTPVSGQKITLHKGAVIKAAIRDWVDDAIIDMIDVTDVTIEGGTLDGDRANNPAGRMFGLAIRGASSRIRVYRTRIVNVPALTSAGGFGGDGLYIGSGTGTPSDVRIRDVAVDNCVRQGLSVTKGENVRVTGCSFTNIVGTDPGAGVDLEPDVAGAVLRDIQITDNTIHTCGRGINVPLVSGSSEDTQGEILIARNRIYNITEPTYGSGIYVSNCREGVKVHTNFIRSAAKWGIYVEGGTDADIQDNTIRDCSTDGIRMGTCLRFGIKGNRVRHSVTGACILISAGTTSGDVEGNTLRLGAAAASYGVRSDVTTSIGIRNNDIYGDSTATGIGVYLGNGGDNHIIAGNTAQTMQYGIRTPAGADNNLVVDNMVKGCATPYLDAGAGNVYKDNDAGFLVGAGTVASAATIALPSSKIVSVTGTTTITSITAKPRDTEHTLVFAGALTVTDGSNLKLAGDFVTTAGDTLTLVCDGTNWQEIARSAI